MAYNTQNLITDASGIKPVPQYYNPTTDAMEPLEGAYGGNRVLLYDASGNPLLTASNPGVVKVSDGTNTQAVNADGSTNVQLSGSNTADVTFQNAVAATGNGTAVSVKGYKTLVVEVYGATSPAGTVNFEAAGTSGVFASITGTNLNGLSQATTTSSISTTPVQWQFDVEALDQFQCPVTWTAGTITVVGRLQA